MKHSSLGTGTFWGCDASLPQPHWKERETTYNTVLWIPLNMTFLLLLLAFSLTDFSHSGTVRECDVMLVISRPKLYILWSWCPLHMIYIHTGNPLYTVEPHSYKHQTYEVTAQPNTPLSSAIPPPCLQCKQNLGLKKGTFQFETKHPSPAFLCCILALSSRLRL